MEFTDMTREILREFKADGIENLPSRILEAILSSDARQYYDAYISICPDLGDDWLQEIWQFYLADRETKKQDFTPGSLAMLPLLMNGGLVLSDGEEYSQKNHE